ncbi:Sec-independent protein translocase protein TatB [Siccirubricoccus sp. G192]|uniref:Sec-independent protein translocase protein TatB n=1 Tax=Siccirubricoccus sp. G192 TaxID=2849651 RepID=UPI001C2B80B4|nr:Sec-independent protein translocase protein TatB [Siccirubricoccus sp. G192]MBV1798423.1 Sec-independent protein translocase protein TatB [Siccirubricoccus sp. G192]
MFDLAWSEIALIGVVALVVIGPKDLPEAVRGLARGVQKLRRMAGEFQQHADDLVKEANLDEVRQQINEIRNFNIRNEFEKTVDRDGTLRKTFTEDPLRTDYSAPPRRRHGGRWRARRQRRDDGAARPRRHGPRLHPAGRGARPDVFPDAFRPGTSRRGGACRSPALRAARRAAA